jgi:hypothetical protein
MPIADAVANIRPPPGQIEHDIPVTRCGNPDYRGQSPVKAAMEMETVTLSVATIIVIVHHEHVALMVAIDLDGRAIRKMFPGMNMRHDSCLSLADQPNARRDITSPAMIAYTFENIFDVIYNHAS